MPGMGLAPELALALSSAQEGRAVRLARLSAGALHLLQSPVLHVAHARVPPWHCLLYTSPSPRD
eukprot:14279777-Alexandrium_andersonii.AAC.1